MSGGIGPLHVTNHLSIVKKKLVDSTLLVHYDSQLPLRLASDASAYSIGAVISHVFPNGTKQPIAFASRTLTSTEKNYPQIEKEALSLVFKNFVNIYMQENLY